MTDHNPAPSHDPGGRRDSKIAFLGFGVVDETYGGGVWDVDSSGALRVPEAALQHAAHVRTP